jgi:hypothetical protein
MEELNADSASGVHTRIQCICHILNLVVKVGIEMFLLELEKGGRGTPKTPKTPNGKTQTLNGHNRSTWYDGKLYLMVNY